MSPPHKPLLLDDLRRVAQAAFEQGQWVQSLAHFESILAIEPLSVQAWLYKARCYVKLGQWVAARDAFEQTVRLDSVHLQASDAGRPSPSEDHAEQGRHDRWRMSRRA